MAINWFNGGPPAAAHSSTQSRFHAIVEAMEAELEAAWLSAVAGWYYDWRGRL